MNDTYFISEWIREKWPARQKMGQKTKAKACKKFTKTHEKWAWILVAKIRRIRINHARKRRIFSCNGACGWGPVLVRGGGWRPCRDHDRHGHCWGRGHSSRGPLPPRRGSPGCLGCPGWSECFGARSEVQQLLHASSWGRRWRRRGRQRRPEPRVPGCGNSSPPRRSPENWRKILNYCARRSKNIQNEKSKMWKNWKNFKN
jgi:hypothetical protein